MNTPIIRANEAFESWNELSTLVPGMRVEPKFPDVDTLNWDNFESVVLLEFLPEEIGAFQFADDSNDLHMSTAAFFFDCRIMIILPDGMKRIFLHESRLLRPAAPQTQGMQ